ncbi:hypothetical protein POV07_23230, partial [Enterobacter roggenkampii]
MVCVVGRMRDLILQLSKSSIYSTKPHLTNKQGQEFPVFPGMIATVDIKTGSKTILDYLLKPLNKAKEALRER